MLEPNRQPFRKINVVCRNDCFICRRRLNTATSLNGHIERIHGLLMQPRAVSYNRPRERDYNFVNEDADWEEERLACPSCWQHFPIDNIGEFEDHVFTVHNPFNINPPANNRTENEPLDRSRSGSLISQGALPSSGQGSRSSSGQSFYTATSGQTFYTATSGQSFHTAASGQSFHIAPSVRSRSGSPDQQRIIAAVIRRLEEATLLLRRLLE